MMKLQDVLLKAMAKKISWADAGEIIGVTDRTMRRESVVEGHPARNGWLLDYQSSRMANCARRGLRAMVAWRNSGSTCAPVRSKRAVGDSAAN
jgi:hypothetical protein